MLDLARRSFLTGLAGTLICSPAIVRASSLMAVKKLPEEWTIEYPPYSPQNPLRGWVTIRSGQIVRFKVNNPSDRGMWIPMAEDKEFPTDIIEEVRIVQDSGVLRSMELPS